MSVSYTEVNMVQGETLHVEVTYLDDDENPVVMDATYSTEAQMSPYPGGTETYDLGATIDLGDGKAKVDYVIPSTLDPGQYWFDVRVTDPAGEHVFTDPYLVNVRKPNSQV